MRKTPVLLTLMLALATLLPTGTLGDDQGPVIVISSIGLDRDTVTVSISGYHFATDANGRVVSEIDETENEYNQGKFMIWNNIGWGPGNENIAIPPGGDKDVSACAVQIAGPPQDSGLYAFVQSEAYVDSTTGIASYSFKLSDCAATYGPDSGVSRYDGTGPTPSIYVSADNGGGGYPVTFFTSYNPAGAPWSQASLASGSGRQSGVAPQGAVVNGDFELGSDATYDAKCLLFGDGYITVFDKDSDLPWLASVRPCNQGATGWSNSLATEVLTIDGDRAAKISPGVVDDVLDESHNMWQTWNNPHLAYTGDFEALRFDIESGTAPSNALVQLNFGTLPGAAILLECKLTLKMPAFTTDNGVRYQADPIDGEFASRGASCNAAKAAWDAGDADDRREVLAGMRIIQLSFWHFNTGSGPVVIDDVELDGAKTIVESVVGSTVGALPRSSGPAAHRDALIQGAEHLLDYQHTDGSFRILGHLPDYRPLNVQGAIPHGLLEAFKATGDTDYLGDETTGVQGSYNWILDHLDENPGVTLTSSGVYFLAEYALLTGDREALEIAREHLGRWIEAYGSPAGLMEYYLGFGSAGLWQTGRWLRAAHDLGQDAIAAEMADTLATQTMVPLDGTGNFHEYGLSWLLMAFGESNVAAHVELVAQVREELLSRQCDNGGFPLTLSGSTSCDAAQSSAFAAAGLAFVGDVATAQEACDFLVASQFEDGRWEYAGIEYVQTNADSLMGLSACLVPSRNAATSYADPAIGLL